MSRLLSVDVDNLSPVEKRALLGAYVERQRARDSKLDQYNATKRELSIADDLEAKWFPKQAEFFKSKAKRRVAFTTRRGGKTIGTALWLCASLLRSPGSLHLYMAQTAGICKLYMWNEIKKLIVEHQLPFRTNETDLTIQHERGLGVIILKGADKSDEIEKLRGPKWLKCALDEAASFGNFIENLILEVLGAALLDQDGELIMTGTAGKKKEGIFYEACHGLRRKKKSGEPVYELHKWSFQDNPYIPQSAKNEDEIIDNQGFSGVDDPRFLREFRGVWAVGESERVFSGYSAERNNYTGELPSSHDWRYLLGVDFGWHDESAMAIMAYSTTSRVIYVCDEWAKSRQYTDDIARQVSIFGSDYGQTDRKILPVVGDTGGYGKSIAMHLQRDYGIFVESAQKRDKLDQLAFINSALERGDIKINAHKCKQLISQLQEVAWNASRSDMGTHERDDRCAAMLYGWRAAKNRGAGTKSLSNDPFVDPGTAFAAKEKKNALRKRPSAFSNEPAWVTGESEPDSVSPRIRPNAWREICGL